MLASTELAVNGPADLAAAGDALEFALPEAQARFCGIVLGGIRSVHTPA